MAFQSHSILQWNINGYFSHLEMLQLLANEVNPSIIGLQETHFNPEKEGCLRNFQGFHCSRANQGRASGGVSVMVKKGNSRLPTTL